MFNVVRICISMHVSYAEVKTAIRRCAEPRPRPVPGLCLAHADIADQRRRDSSAGDCGLV